MKINHIKDINKALSNFMWAGRKPKIKLAILQLSKEQRGWGLPNITNYILYCNLMQARIVSIWATVQPKPPWFEIDATFTKLYSPMNLLDRRRSELPITEKDNFLITNVCGTWIALWKLFGAKHKLNCLGTVTDNPDLMGNGAGSNLQNWYEAGIIHIQYMSYGMGEKLKHLNPYKPHTNYKRRNFINTFRSGTMYKLKWVLSIFQMSLTY